MGGQRQKSVSAANVQRPDRTSTARRSGEEPDTASVAGRSGSSRCGTASSSHTRSRKREPSSSHPPSEERPSKQPKLDGLGSREYDLICRLYDDVKVLNNNVIALSLEKKSLETQLKSESLDVLKGRNLVSIRGGLELSFERLQSYKIIARDIVSVGYGLSTLINAREWQEAVRNICHEDITGARYRDIENCQRYIYHSFSKSLHGHPVNISLQNVDAKAEQIALQATFLLGHIPYEI